MKKPTQSGFTLVELLLVIAIISLIMSIAIANMQNSRYDAYNAAIRQEVRQLVNQARIEYSQIGRFATVNIPADNGFRTLDTCSDKGITDTSILNTCFLLRATRMKILD